MHIKQVVVEGFKTYRETTTVDFQPHLNCIGAPCHGIVTLSLAPLNLSTLLTLKPRFRPPETKRLNLNFRSDFLILRSSG